MLKKTFPYSYKFTLSITRTLFTDVFVHLSNLSNIGFPFHQGKQQHQQLIIRCRHILDIFELEDETAPLPPPATIESLITTIKSNDIKDDASEFCSTIANASSDHQPYLNMSAAGNKCTAIYINIFYLILDFFKIISCSSFQT